MSDLSRTVLIVNNVLDVYKKYLEYEQISLGKRKCRKRVHDERVAKATENPAKLQCNRTTINQVEKWKPYTSMFGESGKGQNVENISLEKVERIAHITERHFKILASLLYEDLRKVGTGPYFVTEDRLALSLLYLAQGSLRKDVSKEHNVPIATVNIMAKETFQAIIAALNKSYLPPNTENLWKQVSISFATTRNLHNCVGVIDGRTFKTRQLKRKIADKNTKGIVGMCVVASCDTNYCFTACDIIPYKKNKVYLRTPTGFTDRFLNYNLTLPRDEILPNSIEPFPYYFIGDTRFPLRSYLMTPYESSASTSLSPKDKQYNEKILNIHEKITENAFGILRSRWKLLESTSRFGDSLAKNMIHASILLHNYLIINEDELYCPPDFTDQWSDSSYTLGEWRQQQAVVDEEESFKRCKPFHSNSICYNGIVARDMLSVYFNKTDI